MKTKLTKRLEELRNEFNRGQEQLDELRNRETRLNETLLRIGGAMQVLEELLVADEAQSTIGDEQALKTPSAPT